MTHEVSHIVPPAKAIPTPPPDPETVALSRRRFSSLAIGVSQPEAPDIAHDWRFVRRALHCWYRVVLAGYDVPLWAVIHTWPPSEIYLPSLLPECDAMRRESFATIEATEPPDLFLNTWHASNGETT